MAKRGQVTTQRTWPRCEIEPARREGEYRIIMTFNADLDEARRLLPYTGRKLADVVVRPADA